MFATLVLMAAGCLLADAVTDGRGPTDERWLTAAVWGPGCAAGVVSLAGFFGAAAGFGRPGREALLLFPVVAALAAWRAGSFRRSTRTAEDAGPGSGLVVLVALVAGYGWVFIRWCEDRPLGSFDGMAIWTYRALQWFRADGAFLETVARLVESKPGYPLLVPGLVTAQYTLWGEETTVIPVATGWFFVIPLAAACLLAVRRWAPAGLGLAAAALLMSTPLVWGSAFAQGADLALASLTLVAAFGLVELARPGDRPSAPAWLVGFFLGLMVWTKNEGMFLAPILVVVTAVAAWLDGRRPKLRPLAELVLGASPGVLATFAFKHVWAPAPEVGRFLGAGFVERLSDPERWRVVIAAFAERAVPLAGDGIWGATVLALTIVLGVAVARGGLRGESWTAWVYAAAAAAFLGFDLVVYLVTPDELGWHLSTSLDRLLMQALPLAVVAVFVLLGRTWGNAPAA